ncbi:MAG: iron-sulfur cluster biosynthesis family protein [Sulfuricellaceae bacterium]
MITVTTSAAEQIRQAAANNDAVGMALRIAARREFDGSIQYGMGFDDGTEEDIQVGAPEGMMVLVAPEHQELLTGATLDYVEMSPGDFRFIFINPNDTGGSSCSTPKQGGGGCGGCGGGCH